MNKDEITFEIVEHIGVFDEGSGKWVGQVNRVSWNSAPAKIDIRYWQMDDISKNRKVGTLSDEAARKLGEILQAI